MVKALVCEGQAFEGMRIDSAGEGEMASLARTIDRTTAGDGPRELGELGRTM
jgi:hypothetical protein